MSLSQMHADAPAPSALTPSSRASPLSAVAGWTIAIALACLVAWLAADLPFARLAVAVVLVACAAVQLRVSAAWLVFLPALLPVADLGLWSGRLYVTEFDLLVLTVAAVHFLQAPAGERLPAVDGRTTLLVLLVPVAFLRGRTA